MCPHLTDQSGLHCVAGGIGGVHHAAPRVPAFARQVQRAGGRVIGRKRHAIGHQPVDHFAALAHHKARGDLVAQAGPGNQGIVDVRFDRVLIIKHRSNAALRPVAGAVDQTAFGNNPYAARPGQMQGGGQGSQAAADN